MNCGRWERSCRKYVDLSIGIFFQQRRVSFLELLRLHLTSKNISTLVRYPPSPTIDTRMRQLCRTRLSKSPASLPYAHRRPVYLHVFALIPLIILPHETKHAREAEAVIPVRVRDENLADLGRLH